MAMAMMAWLIAIPVLGGVTGLRTMTPMAVLCWFAYTGHLDVDDTWAFWTGHLVTVIVFSVLAVGELIGDKLPKTPSRTDLFPLIARVGFGGLIGALAATALRGAVIEGVLLGSISALAGSFLGYHLRQWLVTQRGMPDLTVALSEDAIDFVLSVLAISVISS